jgi:hypothetical protein
MEGTRCAYVIDFNTTVRANPTLLQLRNQHFLGFTCPLELLLRHPLVGWNREQQQQNGCVDKVLRDRGLKVTLTYCYSLSEANLQKALLDRVYDKRKAATLELEK